MVFSSNIFLFLFLPAFILIYYMTPSKWRSYTIMAGSYLFYAWWRVDYLLLVVAISLWSYVASLLIFRAKTQKMALAAMWLGIAGDLGALIYFKYFNFIVENINTVVLGLGQQRLEAWHVILPIGISFHVFQSVSYVIDVYRKDVPPARHLVDFLAFTSLFPQLIAGPVLRYKDLADQFVSREHTWEKFNAGIGLLVIGLSKKILIADTVASMATAMFEKSAPTFVEAWLGALTYTVQLYFDFSGYSDMAIGLALLIGFNFPKNFDNPYISRSITEFWRRWHISLSTWLRDYLYIPLGGNRKGAGRTYFNLVLTMVLGGFWHGASWTFLLWGLWHGGWMALERRLGIKGSSTVYPALIALPFTFVVVVLGWVMFRAPTTGAALHIYAGMVGLNGLGSLAMLSTQTTYFQLVTLAVAYAIVWIGPLWRPSAPIDQKWWSIGSLSRGLMLPMFVLTVFKLSAQSYTPFLYFQF